QPESNPALERATANELASALGLKPEGLAGVWRFLKPGPELRVRVATLQPKIEARTRQEFTIGTDGPSCRTLVDYEITQAGVFVLQFNLPPAWQVDSLQCAAMQGWAERTVDGERVLELTLRERSLGHLNVRLECSQTWTNLPATLALNGPHPRGVSKLSGTVAVAGEAGVGIKSAALNGLVEVPADSIEIGADAAGDNARPRNTGGLLAYKFTPVAMPARQPWQLSITTERLPAWVRAEIVNFASISETLLSGQALVRYEIENAPVQELQLRLPVAWTNIDVAGPGIRRRDHTNNVWRVELQNKVRGQYQLLVRWEQPRAASTNDLALSGPEALGVERESGSVTVIAPAQLQVNPGKISGELQRIDFTELPSWAQPALNAESGAGTAVLNYRYLRPGWKLAVEAKRLSEAALLQALAEQVILKSVVADDGQLMTQMELTVRNNGRQNLALTLPAGMRLWSAFVGGVAVRPTQRGGTLLLPLENGATPDAPVTIELIYVGTARFPRSSGKVTLVSPRLDVPLKNARWDLYLPPDYDYSRFKGSMSHESAEMAIVARDFTGAEYRRQEADKKSSLDEKVLDSLRLVRSRIASGQISEAGAILSKTKSQAARNEPAVAELKELEEKLSEAQGSNLVRAQRDYFFQNNLQSGVKSEMIRVDGNYDAKVAERQVRQLQKAQSVVAAHAEPLRANLPTRGLCHTFTQVLQTEVDHPLTVEFTAANDRATGWFKTAVLCAAGFGLVWLFAAFAVERIKSKRMVAVA
ncbi:MAG TPA: hypothetical protein VHH73_16465, partial [Verrucomicrobiae bacterium]|nr:hypothetical protein [Verrucomicrobiae bacterium]